MNVKAAAELFIIRRLRHASDESSSSSAGSDLEWETALPRKSKRKCRPRIPNYVNLTHQYSDDEFKSHFRMSRATFEYLNDILREDLTRQMSGCPTIPSYQQLLIAIWKMATMDSYRSVCDRFNVGRATAVRAVRRVVNALFKRASRFIQWPTGERAFNVIRGFEVASGFPNVIGAIDGTHIRVNAPKMNPADYINRKSYHSIQLQLVCDHKALITHCYAGHPGSVHDQRVFRLSEMCDYINQNEKFPNDSHIVGDAAYELHHHLLTPFRNNGRLTERQKNYNHRQSVARVTVERCIALLKGRMRSLLDRLPMLRVDLMAKYIVACCVIHNICIMRHDEIQVIPIPALQENEGNFGNEMRRAVVGIDKRNRIMNTLRLYN